MTKINRPRITSTYKMIGKPKTNLQVWLSYSSCSESSDFGRIVALKAAINVPMFIENENTGERAWNHLNGTYSSTILFVAVALTPVPNP